MFIKETSIKTLSYYLLVAITLLLSVICLFYQLNRAFTKPEKPILPTNPISSSSTPATSDSTGESSTAGSLATSSSTNSSSHSTETTASSKKETKPITHPPLNLILTATLDQEEKGKDIIRTYIVNEPIEKSDFEVTIKQVTLAKLTENSMKSTGYDGEGILDIELRLNNQTKEEVKIFPSQIALEVNGAEVPISLSKTFTDDTTVKPKEQLTDSFLTAFPKLAKIDEVTEFGFTWITEINNVTQPYNITILLKEK